MAYMFVDKKHNGSGVNFMPNQLQLENELHKPVIRKFWERRVYFSSKENIRGVDSAAMQLISKYNKGIRYIL